MAIKVRLTTFARNDYDLLKLLSKRYNNGSFLWKDIEFVHDDSYDKLIVFTYPYEEHIVNGYNERKTLTFMTEPSVSHYAQPHPTSHVMNCHLPLPFLPKEILGNADFGGNGIEIEKTKILSCVTSELNGLIGHTDRLQFIYYLDQIVNDGFDVYGRPVNGEFFNLLSNYKGTLDDKFDGLWNYSYHFACENSYENGYFTEKLIDPLISETLCFYDGCPNIQEFINEKAYIKIPVQDIEASFEIIINNIDNNSWEKNLLYIQKEKLRFLTDLHPFNMIWMAVHEKDILSKVKIN